MGQYSSYYLYQKYEKRGDQPFVPVYPAVYSVDGDGTREPVVKNENDYQCGWTGETGTLYRWVDLPIDTDYICDECPVPQYRWVTVSGYVCSGTTKYNKEQEQVSYDSGVTWSDVVPAQYRRGSTIIETESEDCGYVPPIEPQYRWVDTGEYRCEYSADTPDEQYRWYRLPINEDYMCSGTSKYYKEVYQVSTDSGVTWSDVVPAQYRMGDLYEASSSDCESEPYSGQYFTIESLVDNNGVWFESHNSRTISASTDGGNTWSGYTASSGNNRPTIATLNTGQKVLIKGLNSTYYDFNGTGYVSSNFDTSGNYIVYGNIMSLVYGDSFTTATTLTGDHNFTSFFSGKKLISAANLVLPATTLTENCYATMFSGCGYLTAAPELPATTLANACYNGMFRGTSLTTAPELPATTLAEACYGGMFYGCTSLTTAPELPATTLANSCYHSMFQGCRSLTAAELPATTLASSCYRFMFQSCTSLVNAPELPATTLADSCYGGMFLNCTSLTTASELPATTLVDGCYDNMFDGCKRLNYIKAMFTTTPHPAYTDSWVNDVASSGTFVKNSAATWYLRGVDGIPTGWTVQNA